MFRYLKIITIYFKHNIQRNLIYRFDAFFTFIATTVYIFSFILSLRFVFNFVEEIGGFDYSQLYILLLFSQIWWYFNVIFVRKNFQYISDSINNGKLDLLLTKPMNLRSLTPFVRFDVRHIMPLIVASVLLYYELSGYRLSMGSIVLSLLVFLVSVLVNYAINSILTTLSFWSGRNDAVFDVTLDFPEIIRIPKQFFPDIISFVFTFILPISLFANFPYDLLFKKSIDYSLLIYYLSYCFIMLVLSEIFWRIGLKNYSSTS